MAAAIHERPPAPHCPIPRRISRVASEPLATGSSSRSDRHSITPHDNPGVAQLACLASQHHASEYSRLKFGPNGSPLVYVPYSLQMPEHFKEMQTHQMRCAEQPAWWPHKRKDCPATRIWPSNDDGCESLMSKRALPRGIAAVNIQEQLSAAMDSSIVLPGNRRASPTPQSHWQTSETHPIVISTIVPPELLSSITTHSHLATEPYPVTYNVSASHQLHRIIPSSADPTPRRVNTQPLPPSVLVPPRSSHSQLPKSLKLSSIFWVHPTVKRAFTGGFEPQQLQASRRARPVSFVQPPHLRTRVEPSRPKVSRKSSSPSILNGTVKETTLSPYTGQTVLSGAQRSAAVIEVTIPAVPTIPPAAITSLGNLYLSSCPGKKVRLDGPVRGRNTVCRDLMSDLSRIKGVGVACIVCCLDDNELLSLGVSWPEYAEAADDLGIDVLRIPTPEGLAPLDASTLDSHLTRLIDSYTRRGAAILVHCRGGIGRAGIIACCWMLKLGLCGWLTPGNTISTGTSRAGEIGEETLRLVERLITVVRRRRSPKAVETYEQVLFLVEYVEFLRQRAAESSNTLFPVDLFADWDTHVD